VRRRPAGPPVLIKCVRPAGGGCVPDRPTGHLGN
jgi:hypothetical protein